MSEHSYKKILTKARAIKENAEQKQKKSGALWSYFIAKAILTKKDVKKIKVENAKKSEGDNFGRQIKKADYTDMAIRFVAYVEKHNQLPNNISIGNKRMRVSDYTLMFANIIISYNKNGKLPDKVNVNSKVYKKPVEYPNKVYELFVKHTGIKPKKIDEVCDWVKNKVDYLFYYDDVESNEEVIKLRKGNCTDLLQFLINMAEAMDYEWKVIHVRCNQSGVGHVYGIFRRKDVNDGQWFIRDIACIADESRYCIWCEAGNGGTKIAENPSWFLENLRR